jgi:hypothetical protein
MDIVGDGTLTNGTASLSGAGKTVSAKYIMRYFATADDQESTGKRKKTDGSMTEVEEQILGKTCASKLTYKVRTNTLTFWNDDDSNEPYHGSLWERQNDKK